MWDVEKFFVFRVKVGLIGARSGVPRCLWSVRTTHREFGR